jgi:hypothetical protein
VHGTNYFDDLVALYRSLNLAIENGTATVFPTLTPFKERETHIIAPCLDRDLKESLYLTLRVFVEQLGVRTFNLVLYQPPLSAVEENWEGFPYIFRLIDRGDLGTNRSDIGGMEMYAQSVVTTDPYSVTDALRASGLPTAGFVGQDGLLTWCGSCLSAQPALWVGRPAIGKPGAGLAGELARAHHLLPGPGNRQHRPGQNSRSGTGIEFPANSGFCLGPDAVPGRPDPGPG